MNSNNVKQITLEQAGFNNTKIKSQRLEAIKEEIAPFFVPVKEYDKTLWVDINDSGREYEEFEDIPFDECEHGLCEKLGRPVYKLMNKGMVLVAKEHIKEEKTIKPITVHYKQKREWKIIIDTEGWFRWEPVQSKKNEKEVIHNWRFESEEIIQAIEGLKEGESAKEIAIRCCCSVEAAEKLIEVIETKNLGGDMDGERIRRTTGHRKKRARCVKRPR